MNQALQTAILSALQSGDLDALHLALHELEGAIRAEETPQAQHLRGLLLERLERTDEALSAQRRALALEERFPEAHYSAGLLLADHGFEGDAARHWQRAVELAPDYVDAWYNLGQLLYGRREFGLALEAWQHAAALVPNDFEITKKIVQAQRALSLWDEASATMQTLFDIYHSSADPAVRELYEVVVDQFIASEHLVMAAEMLRPRSPDLHYETVFYVLNNSGERVMTVQLESSQYGRENGVPYILGISTDKGHQSIGPTFAVKPSYASLKPLAVQAINAHFGAPSSHANAN